MVNGFLEETLELNNEDNDIKENIEDILPPSVYRSRSLFGLCCEHLLSFIISVSVSRLRPRGRDGRLSQIEDVCPRQDVTCADDTNKVVKVIFSVQSAKVNRLPNLLMCKSRLKIIIHINLLWNCSISSGILILFPHLHSLHP